ncbi:AAA family ATPase [Pseudanabaena sp. FACHB-2040]|uniref:AAA family ATPase n=1 Tax=Pseudanabaena sp. FACHB-2040 TaxID=2692859 RepID=UPI001683324E|nr:AAA family ATPase [Pseudanabaena sp. FACHB-2040]MBD2256286.1 AAA family ATPase [Pseudanabaena sp. FACHB-2040]
MPKLRNLANRTKELNIFLKMAEGNYDCRIMLIEGESGMGKTSLLNRFRQECPSEVKYVPFDCKGVNSIAAFLSEVVTDLGHDKFPAFGNKVRLFVQGGVDFSENDIAAEKSISIAINSGVDPQTQEYRLEELEKAFFYDLAKLEHRTVITLDTYQSASELLRNWIESKWLRAVGRLRNVVTVIAGQLVPASNHSVWGDDCEHFVLKPISEIEAWCKFCSELLEEAVLSEDAIKAIALGCKGHPANIHQMLSIAAEQW